MRDRRPWTEEEKEFLRKNYASTNTVELAKALQRTVWSVRAQATKLGVTKSINKEIAQPLEIIKAITEITEKLKGANKVVVKMGGIKKEYGIIKLYTNYVLVQRNGYREAINYKDIVVGEVQIQGV